MIGPGVTGVGFLVIGEVGHRVSNPTRSPMLPYRTVEMAHSFLRRLAPISAFKATFFIEHSCLHNLPLTR